LAFCRGRDTMLGKKFYLHLELAPGQITFAYTAPPTRLLANGENMTHHHNLRPVSTLRNASNVCNVSAVTRVLRKISVRNL